MGTLEQVALRLRQLFDNLLSVLQRLLRLSSHPQTHPQARACEKRPSSLSKKARRRSLDDLAADVQRQFTRHLTTARLADMAAGIRLQLDRCAKSSPVCMLPSFNHTLPRGDERGTFLALDVGGSTFRVALVELAGHGRMNIIRMASSAIDEPVKRLEGRAFFDWIAAKIDEMLRAGSEGFGLDAASPLLMGLSWSFPIDQTSIRSGLVISMGKGFLCSNGTVGEDLSELIMAACRKRHLNVRIEAIVNDSSATLLSRAYIDPSTRMSLILGTGTNVAIHYPTRAIGREKFGDRPESWFEQASHVIINTEMSMFGGDGVLPMTRWDDDLNRSHIKPDYQPLEYLITGRYIGEIVRLIIVEAVAVSGLFGGDLPVSMRLPYSLDTAIVACIEADTSPALDRSTAMLKGSHTFAVPPSTADMRFLQTVCQCVSRRGAAYLATAIYSLWRLRNESESPASSPIQTQDDLTLDKAVDAVHVEVDEAVTIACDGTVINKYPGFRSTCQDYLNSLTANADTNVDVNADVDAISSTTQTETETEPQTETETDKIPVISLDPAPESGIFGAAVAVAVALPSSSS
ncbi:hexokinase-1 [Nannizzia gypsea CBS 118893]|uniref:Phosphotransferase n=1 Tax=Arthroderma gypseum (strain ATCC MYA-4604 / CBS 118893) TaxID=535722 RepID=E4V595_ARTGP|nr:hexokinase-1 [Nannizzia gypsea CBS 118893]EFR05169.1 hexokinase-1 [Nannizzia gypsea CBS 118893]